MGVPAFFRWLSRKYPSIVANSNEDKPREVDGVEIPVDLTGPNPNGVEFDNLYLDMNGIVHPCCHSEHSPPPKDEHEMMCRIFEYIDRLMSICRPRRLLYMAIDGVAPRAKMNQQRSRRFRSVKEAAEARNELAQARAELELKGIPLPPEKAKGEHFDSNCITPGTPFMAHLAESLRYYVQDRLNNNPGWAKIEVILSDANAPGEGEHKIMDFIRRQRASPGHDPNTKHILCGADADLIMLGLATHEPYFTIIREEFVPHQARACKLCGQLGHELKDCEGLAADAPVDDGVVAKAGESSKNFIFIRINVLREYLAKDLNMAGLPFPFDLERAIDDWVFMCFFVGNDFLPHLPSLEIREGAIDRLIKLYKAAVHKTGGWLTDAGRVELSRVELIVSELGQMEDEIFKQRQSSELNFRRKQKDRKRRERAQTAPAYMGRGDFAPRALGRGREGGTPIANPRQQAAAMRQTAGAFGNAAAARDMRAELGGGRKRGRDGQPTGGGGDVSSDEEPADEVRLFEAGWKERYYQAKFEVSEHDFAFRHKVGRSYVEGLLWVLRYYYQGCCSWKWFFPYHYAPFASDFHEVGEMGIEFNEPTAPFKPLEQLMGVFPAASQAHLPPSWRPLMTDPESPILDFYPDDFQVDLNGKKYAWQGVALLPFVEEARLLETLATVYDQISDAEAFRNTLANDRVFISHKHPAFDFFKGILESSGSDWATLEPSLLYGMSGLVRPAPGCTLPGDVLVSPVNGCPDVPGNASIGLGYKDPEFPADFWFPASKLEKADSPEPTLKPGDFPSGRGGGRGGFRPQIGMSRGNSQASVGRAGHRMVNHYASIPPPDDLHRGRDSQRRGGDGHRSQSTGGGGARWGSDGRVSYGSNNGGRSQGGYGQQGSRYEHQSQGQWGGYGGGGGGGTGQQSYGQQQQGYDRNQQQNQGFGQQSRGGRGGGRGFRRPNASEYF